ncbi:hypothetical protein [Deinococcus radiopugnans]|nr:hypothetical protein [Deinococcus radiopugnans]
MLFASATRTVLGLSPGDSDGPDNWTRAWDEVARAGVSGRS